MQRKQTQTAIELEAERQKQGKRHNKSTLRDKKIRNTKCRDIHNRQRQKKRNVGPILRDKKQSYRDSHTNTYIDRHRDKDIYIQSCKEREADRGRDMGTDSHRRRTMTEVEIQTERQRQNMEQRESERNGQSTSCKKSYLNAVLRQQRYITVIESDVAFENVGAWSEDSFEPRSVELSTLQSTNGHDGRCTGTIQQ